MATKKATPKAQVSYAFTADAESNAQTIEDMVQAIGDEWPAYLHIHNRMPMPIVLSGCVRGLYLQHVAAPNVDSAGMYYVSNVEKLHKLALEVQALAKMNNFVGGITMLIGDVEGGEVPVDPNAEPIVVLFPSYPEGSYEIEQGTKLVIQAQVSGGTQPHTFTWKKDAQVISGASTNSLTIDSFAEDDAGAYTLIATDNKGGRGEGSVEFSYKGAEPEPEPEPDPIAVSIAQGQTLNVNYGAAFSLDATAKDGTAPYTYQWACNDQAIAGATNATLSIASAGVSDVGTYTVTATDSKQVTATASIAVQANALAAISVSLSTESPTLQEGARFEVTATPTGGLAPYAYQWTKDSQPMQGSTTATLVIESATAADEGTYMCIVTDNYGGKGQAGVYVEVEVAQAEPLEIAILQGAAIEATVGDPLTLQSNVTGGIPPFTYAWAFNGQTIEGQDKDALSVSKVYPEYEGRCRVTVTDSRDEEATAEIAVSLAPFSSVEVALDHDGTTVEIGSALTITATVTGGVAPYNYTWKKDDSDVPQFTGNTLQIASFAESDAGEYVCIVKDGIGDEANGLSTIYAQQIEPLQATAVRDQIAIEAGGKTSLQVNASGGTAPYSYKWQKDSEDLEDGDENIYTLINFQADDAGKYTCMVMDAKGQFEIASTYVTLFVPLSAAMTVNGDAVTAASELEIDKGEPVTLAANATGGTPPYTYAWRRGDAAIEGQTGQTLEISDFQEANVGRYVATVTDADKKAVQTPDCTLKVAGGGKIDAIFYSPPESERDILIGESAYFEIEILSGSTGAPKYQWFKDGVELTERTAYAFEIESFAEGDAGTYSCIVTDSYGGQGTAEIVVTARYPVDPEQVSGVAKARSVEAGSTTGEAEKAPAKATKARAETTPKSTTKRTTK